MSESNTFLSQHKLPDPVCLYKWGWSTIHLYLGQTNSCHRVTPDPLDVNNYSNFHNTPKKIADRNLMLNGKWPTGGCEYCKKVEDAKGVSDRLEMNDWGANRYAPKETKYNSNEVILTPTMVEVYFNNTCNMSCIYCNAQFSSVWETEDRKFNTNIHFLNHLEQSKKNYADLLEMHWKWMRENAINLKRYHILGGEPFFQKEFEDNIEFFSNNPCPDLEVAIFTNLKVEKEKMKKILDKISILLKNKHIKKFRMTLSIDCWGPEIEYIRYGLNLKKWEDNFNIIINDYPEIDVLIHSTLTSLCMPSFPELCKKVQEWNKIRFIDHSASFADNKPHMHVDAFPINFFKKEFENAINYSAHNNDFKIKLQGMEKRVDSVGESKDNIIKLKSTLDWLDSRRGTNWRLVWPWLNQYEV